MNKCGFFRQGIIFVELKTITMSLNSSLEKLEELGEKRDQASYDFIKQILIVASSLFAIIVSLHRTSEQATQYEKLSFTASIVLLSIGIVSLAISLYSDVAVRKEKFNKWREEVIKRINDENHKIVVHGAPHQLYQYIGYIGYFSLVLAVISLATYAILIA